MVTKIRKIANLALPTLTYSSPIEDPIVIQHSIGSIRDGELNAVLQDRLKVPHDRQRTPMYKFIRAEPPVPYTATVLWRILMVFHKPFQSQYMVKYSTVREECQTLFTPWLSKDKEQLTPGRLNKALDLLQYLGWVQWNKSAGEIMVFPTRGTRVADLADYFCERAAKREIEGREKTKLPFGQRRLEEFMA